MVLEKKKILVVDDEPKILEVVSAVLESQNYQVFTADTGSEAFGIFQRESLSLIVLDLMLPDITGEELCKTIRKNPAYP
jgi:DNA-binding response OmpR family regulator